MVQTKSQVVAAFRRAEILEAARRVFGQRGYAAASVDEIARAASVAKGTVYLYYPSKQAIYWAALRAGLTELRSQLRERTEREPTLDGKIRAFVATKVEYLSRHRDFFRIYQAEFGRVARSAGCLQKDLRGLYQEQLELLRSAIEAGVKRKEIRKLRPELAALGIVAVTRELITEKLLASPASAVDVDAVVELLWKGLAGR